MLLGLAAAVALTAAVGPETPDKVSALPVHGPALPDCEGAIRELVIQYVPEAARIVETAYRDFLGQLPKDVTVFVVCTGRAAFDDLRARVGRVACRLMPVCTGHAMTCWSRDRWLAFAPKCPNGPTLLLSPQEETGAAVWPQRKGDHQVADDIAAALRGRVVSHRSTLGFDGGDFVADGEAVFVTPEVARRNVGISVASSDRLRRALSAVLQRKVVLLRESPPYHAGMFMMLAGGRTAVVGDPFLARRLLLRATAEPGAAASCPLESPDFSDETQRRFDAVAAQCAAEGYRVVRIPVVPATDGRTYLTYLNVILDQRAGTRTVYMPIYRGTETLNRAAAVVWQALGYEVRRVDCTETYIHFGSLRCLVNVLRRSSPARRERNLATVSSVRCPAPAAACWSSPSMRGALPPRRIPPTKWAPGRATGPPA